MTGARMDMLATLRSRIARLEVGEGAHEARRVALGHAQADALLQGGLATGAPPYVRIGLQTGIHKIAALLRYLAQLTAFQLRLGGNRNLVAGSSGAMSAIVEGLRCLAVAFHLCEITHIVERESILRIDLEGLLEVVTRRLAVIAVHGVSDQQPFTTAAQQVTGRLVAVSFHCDNLPRGGVFNESEQPLPLNPDYAFTNFVTGPCNRLPHAAAGQAHLRGELVLRWQ